MKSKPEYYDYAGENADDFHFKQADYASNRRRLRRRNARAMRMIPN